MDDLDKTILDNLDKTILDNLDKTVLDNLDKTVLDDLDKMSWMIWTRLTCPDYLDDPLPQSSGTMPLMLQGAMRDQGVRGNERADQTGV